MSYSEYEILLLWLAAALYMLATVLTTSGSFWNNDKVLKISYRLGLFATVPHGLALLIRWIVAGRAPYQDTYEKLSSYAWFVLVMYFLVVRMLPVLRHATVILFPATLILTGIAVFQSKEITEVPATYQTFWLVIHIIFAKLAYGGALFATATSIFYLVKTDVFKLRWHWITKLPTPGSLDYTSYRLTAFTFVMLTVMIASGAIWAHQAWGRYWFWDPIETWSLISWLCYGLYLHLRFTGGKPKHAAMLNIFSLFLLIVTFFGLPYLYDSIHRT